MSEEGLTEDLIEDADIDDEGLDDDLLFEESTWETLLIDHDIIVGCGSGGVGKTTISAALALQGARLGRRSCVVTIGPARTLGAPSRTDHVPK